MKNRTAKEVLIALALVLMLAPLTVFAGGQKEAPVASAPEKESDKTVTPETAPDWLIENNLDHITLIDGAGKKVTVKKPVERIIPVASESMLVVIKAIGAKDKVLAVSEHMKQTEHLGTLFPEMRKLPSFGSVESPDYEKIFELKPDVVIAPYYITEELEEKLGPEITIIRLNCGPPLTYAENVRKLGLILGTEDRTEEYLKWIQSHVDTIAERVEGFSVEDKPRVFDYYGGDWGMSEGPPYGTYGKENFWVGPLIEMAGGTNIASDLPGDWITVDAEWVITQNPSIIIREVYPMVFPVMGYDLHDLSKAAAMLEDIIGQPAIEFTDAAQEGRVHLLLGDLIQVFWFVGIQYMAK